MQNFYRGCVLLLLTVGLAACSTLEFPGVYRLTIDQGNIVKQDMVDQLEPGMSREQVLFVLGSPLIKDTFNADRWDYVYNIRKGRGPMEQYRLTVFFDNDALSHFTGDFTPSEAAGDTPVESGSEQASPDAADAVSAG